jgi:CheY-like chemotaxis protein/nitrogen-specific signal transduction histidine kinase
MFINYRLRIRLSKTETALSAQLQGKLDMITNFNRDVRTPLNAVIGMSEQLAHTRLDKEQFELVHTIEHAAGLLQRVLDNSWQISSLEKGKIHLDALPFDLYAAFTLFIAEKRSIAFTKSLYLEARYDGEQHLRITGDEKRLVEIMHHLVDNAIKYTQSGGVVVHLQLEHTSEDKGLVKFSVKDTGVGIHENMFPYLFGYYSVARPAPVNAESGSGVGLAITRRLLQLHHAALKVESEVGKGSTFSFEIGYPMARAQTMVISARELEEMPGRYMEGRNVLIADDQEMNLVLLSRILSRWKCNFDKANDGIAAYELFSQHDYDLVLLDIQMPGMNGNEVVKKIRQDSDQTKAKVPVLAITSDITMTDNGRFSELGFDDCLLKPFREKDIYSTIIRHLPLTGVKVV